MITHLLISARSSDLDISYTWAHTFAHTHRVTHTHTHTHTHENARTRYA